ncbi:MAG TPA: hypothetical protein VD969_23200 [Symbiobacteriaceae bacterium]|nr:hypothetical protein [Symbiobacteriaceae bacterium]
MKIPPIELLMLLGLGFVAFKVMKLERMLESGARRKPLRLHGGDPKVIPILKEHIEPGPFKPDKK